ncbi:DNA helicase [Rothia sp. CCM 9419]|uniref:DNA helicase n=1 Tax=Rothia sp. CCM 9419 TaxID=3402662 RepID=UPI003ADBD2A7
MNEQSATPQPAQSWESAGSSALGTSAPSVSEQLENVVEILDYEKGLETWNRQMDLYTGPDALLDFNQIDYVHIDITDANPSGLAQLMMGRKTRLSTIIRDKNKRESAMRAAQALRSKIFELENQHGLSAGYFAAGTASWLSRDVHHAQGAPEKRFIAPVLLTPIVITPHPTSEDFEIRLSGSAKLNPAMVRQIHKEYGIDLGSMDVAQLANSMSKLDPEPVIDRMRTSTGHVPGMLIESKYLISTFADIKENAAELPEDSFTPLVRKLAKLALEPEDTTRPEVFVNNSAAPLDQRAPHSEMLAFDADSSAQEIIDLARSGHSLVVTAPSGTEPLQMATNIATTLIHDGKSVLVVGERSSTVENFASLLKNIGLDQFTFDLLKEHSSEELRELLVQAIIRNENAACPNMSDVYERLVSSRNKLISHTNSLKFTESRWGCSVYDALQTLAALMTQNPAPTTTVRFNRHVMDALSHRAKITEKIERFAQLRAFRPSTLLSSWHRAKLYDQEECKAAHRLVKSLIDSLQSMHAKMSQLSEQTGLRMGESYHEWDAQLQLLERIRQTLTKFRVDVYDRPVTDLIAATASSAWRREHGIEMSSIQRSRLRKAAKEYIVPGVHINDLHENLLIVQQEREEWIARAVSPREPQVPANLTRLQEQLAELADEFSGLAIVLEDHPDGNDFLNTEYSVLLERLTMLDADEELLYTLPEREEIRRELYELGLEEFLADLLKRQVPAEHVSAELELAWWQSALEKMLDSDEIEILDGDSLRILEEEFRTADQAHIAATPARLGSSIRDIWNNRIVADPDAAAYLKSQLRGHHFDFDAVLKHSSTLVHALYPLWTSSPFALTRRLANTVRFDAVILLDAESTPLAANLPAIIRTEQVIAIGDPHSGFPAPFMVSAVAKNAPLEKNPKIESTYSALSKILPARTLALLSERTVDPAVFSYLNDNFYSGALNFYPWGEEISEDIPAFIAEYIDATGKISDNSNLDSPAVEVDSVAKRVLEHAYKNPNQSLAVVTASTRHARRIAEAVRSLLVQYPQMLPFFNNAQHGEPFRVVDLSRASGLERDVVIFSLGTGKGHNGVVNHKLGQLSEPHGREYFVLGMTRARHLTRLMSCVSIEDLDPALLEYGALDLYKMLREHENWQKIRHEEQTATITDRIPQNEFLRNADIEAIDMGDWLLNDMVRRLGNRGVHLREHGTQGISLVAYSEHESLMAGSTPSPRRRKSGNSQEAVALNFPLAACSDGSDEFASMSVRERTRLLPDRLARTGWNYMTLWTIEVFSDPHAVAERMCRYLGVEDE